MSKGNREDGAGMEGLRFPEWFNQALAIAGELDQFYTSQEETTSTEFRQRCQDSARVALCIAKLRRERLRVGFVPLSVGDYIAGLAKGANINLTPILEWFGITDLAKPNPGSAGMVGRLAREIGMSLREALVQVRISFAAHFDSNPMALTMAHRRSGDEDSDRIQDCEDVLNQLESRYDRACVGELRNMERDVRAAFESNQSDPA